MAYNKWRPSYQLSDTDMPYLCFIRLQELKRPIVGGDMAVCENTAWIQELRDQVTMVHVLELSGGQGLLLILLLSSSYKNALMSLRNFEFLKVLLSSN